MTKRMLCFVLILMLFTGCTTLHDSDVSKEYDAITSLNKQIDKFNVGSEEHFEYFVPVSHVYRIEYISKHDEIICFNKDGDTFLILNREKDGSFKGVLSVYAPIELEEGLLEQTIEAKFYLASGMF